MPNEAPDALERNKDTPESGAGEGALISNVLASEGDLKLALMRPQDSSSDEGTLNAFDGDNGPEITDDTNVSDAKTEDNTVKDDQGRTVRMKSDSGNDTVIAYDNNGAAHEFEDTKIDTLPVDMSNIPDWRQEQIKAKAGPLIDKYTEGAQPNGSPDGVISFNDVASMMKDVSKMDDLTELEKARLWSDIRIKLQKDSVPMIDADEIPEMKDTWKGISDPWHAIITMNDGYHANRLVNMSEEDASKAIMAHEDGSEAHKKSLPRSILWHGAMIVYGINQGDINASEGTLRALREYRSNGTFEAYADAWKENFVRTDVDQYGKKRSTR